MILRIINIGLFITFIYTCLTACGQAATQTVKASKAGKDTATCILLSPETMTYYYGDSATMEEQREGSIYDHVFMSHVLTSIKKHSKSTGFKVAIKPIASADAMSNLAAVIDIFNTNGIQNRYVDETDLAILRQPLKLDFPVDDSTAKPVKVGKDDITILLYGDNIYAYQGKDITRGLVYNYKTIDGYIKSQVKQLSADGFAVIIKPNDDSSYKNVVDILDEMKMNNIEKYTLVDITKDEVAYIKTLK